MFCLIFLGAFFWWVHTQTTLAILATSPSPSSVGVYHVKKSLAKQQFLKRFPPFFSSKKRTMMNGWQRAYLVIMNDVKQQQRKHSEAPQICSVFLFFFLIILFYFIIFIFSDRKEGTFGVSKKQNDEVFYFFRGSFWWAI